MAVGFDVLVTGQKELDRKLRALDRRVKRKLTRKATKVGAKMILDQAKSNAESMVGGEMGGLLSKNLTVRVFKKQRRGSYGVAVRLKSGAMGLIWITQDGTQEYIPAAIEFGHHGGWQQANPTFVAAIPFMRPAFDSKVRPAIVAIGNILKTGLAIS